MKNIHVLVTDKPSRLFDFMTALVLLKKASPNDSGTNQNIYITSDEEIKEGDKSLLFIEGFEPIILTHFEPIEEGYEGKKIILTTDQDLIKGGIQPISDEFLQWFVKNSSCERVEIQCRYNFYAGQDLTHYKIIIPQEEPRLINNCPKCGLDLVEREGSKPVCTRIDCGGIMLSNKTLREWVLKEEPKQYPISGYAPGFYSCTCVTCKEEFQGHKRATQCEPCAIKMTQDESKNTCPKCRTTDFDNCHSIKCPMRKEEPKQTDENGKPITYWGGLEEPEQEIVGYRLKPFIDRIMVDGILKNAMPIWNDEDKSVYFIRGHVGGSLVAKMKELKVLDLWFTPIYESEEVKSDWIKEHHIDYYKKEGMMADKPKQETIEEAAEKYARMQCEDLYDNEGLTGSNWGWETSLDFINGAKSDAAREYWYSQFQEQDKNKFSKEEVIEIVEKIRATGLTAEYLILTEQFKIKNNEQ